MAQKPTVLVLGATGNTGGSIVTGLLNSNNFHVVAAVRPSSENSQGVADLKARGVEIRIVDLERADEDQLDAVLLGVDTVISAILVTQLQLQRPLIDAAKRTGVKRFVPCDFGTACKRGVRAMHDEKLGIHDYIQDVGIPYTFIDVGWWMQITLPIVDTTSQSVISRWFFDKEVKCAVTDLRDIGSFVARIVADSRTLNRYVFCWAEEVTQREVFDIAKKASGGNVQAIEGIDIHQKIEEARVHNPAGTEFAVLQYINSIRIRGDNTVEHAKQLEYGAALDARELYPDLVLRKLVDFAAEHYAPA